jgi:hypothetical protein
MIQAILLPCEFFEINHVDSCYQNEFDALVKSNQFEIYFYDYDTFVSEGILKLNKRPNEMTSTLLRGWMLNDKNYEIFYNKLLDRNIKLITTPQEYCNMHLFPNVYEYIKEDTPKTLVYPEGCDVDLSQIKSCFKKFLIKDYVKSEKGTDFPTFFDNSISDDEFNRWLKIFKEYRANLFTGGFCIKEFVDLKKYGNCTNEWRVFYMNKNIVSVSKNSLQLDYVNNVPNELIEKYKNLPSPFYTVDYAELEDGTWKILEAGDGQVSGLSPNQDAESFFRTINIIQN